MDNNIIISRIQKVIGVNETLLLDFDNKFLFDFRNNNNIADLASDIISVDKIYDSIVINLNMIMELSEVELTDFIKRLYQINAKSITCVYDSELNTDESCIDRLSWRFWEEIFIKNGYRKHLLDLNLYNYKEKSYIHMPALMFFEKIQPDLLNRYSLEFLKNERDLHMDMLREPSDRADAHIGRYLLASSIINWGDKVLDCVCGMGYGSAIMAAGSVGKDFIAVDLSKTSIDYAKNMYSEYNIDFVNSDACDLSFIEDNSIDFAVSFETIEHLKDYNKFLSEILRVLKPNGRFICSVPNLWVDETGNDPNPYHFHVFDSDKIKNVLSEYFIVENIYNQSPVFIRDTSKKHRVLEIIEDDQQLQEKPDWIIATAVKDPLKYNFSGYSHSLYDNSSTGDDCHLVDFKNYYQNPWIWKQFIETGTRIKNKNLLISKCFEVLKEFPLDSADTGAALTVICYNCIDSGEFDNFSKITNNCDSYIQQSSDNPHILRWKISLSYVVARIETLRGNINKAIELYNNVIEFDFLKFSPLIATKVLSACYNLGLIYWQKNDYINLKAIFEKGVHLAIKAINADKVNSIGDEKFPFIFSFEELADILYFADKLSKGLNLIEKMPYAKGTLFNFINPDTEKIENAELQFALNMIQDRCNELEFNYRLDLLKLSLNNFLSQNPEKKLALYGAGKLTEKLLESLPSHIANIIGVIDKNKDKHGTYLYSYKICSFEDIANLYPDTIMLSIQKPQMVIESLNDYLFKNNLKISIII